MLETPIDPHQPTLSPPDAHREMLDALLAGEGLDRVEEIASEQVGAPVRILVPRPGSDGSGGTPVERHVAALVAGEEPEMPEEIVGLSPIVSTGRLQGAVVMLGEGGAESERYLRAAAVASLTGVAVLNARDEATRPPSQGLLTELVAGRAVPPGEIVRRARSRGCDLAAGAVGVCAEPREGGAVGMLVAVIAGARPDSIAEAVGDRAYALLPGTPEEGRRLAAALDRRALVAVSSRYDRTADAALALEEAALLVMVAGAGGYERIEGPSWPSIRLLFRTFVADPDYLECFAEETVGPILDQDERQGSELEGTFRAYVAADCNMNVAARSIYTHRHTISNRLARIKELTGLDPVVAEDREQIGLGLKAHCVVTLARPR